MDNIQSQPSKPSVNETSSTPDEESSLLDRVTVASPCPASWEKMIGNDQVRYCGYCEKNVYNLSGMSRAEAEELVRRREGRMCARFFRRADGKMLTENCPVGLRTLRTASSKLAVGMLTMLTVVVGVVGYSSYFAEPDTGNRGGRPWSPIDLIPSWLIPAPTSTFSEVGGAIYVQPPPTSPPQPGNPGEPKNEPGQPGE